MNFNTLAVCDDERIDTYEFQDYLIRKVMACTAELVEQALQCNWEGVLDGMEKRRSLLECLVETDNVQQNRKIRATQEAVAESERALMRVVAHAIASSRWHGAGYALRH
ncbi:MAG: hypothetical protein QM808_01350 [Steroidobacteraceae bacterium]